MGKKVELRRLKTCISCAGHNPYDARKCNHCGDELHEGGLFSKCNFHKQWVCPKCDEINMEANKKCMCGYDPQAQAQGCLSLILKILFWLIVFVFVIAILSVGKH